MKNYHKLLCIAIAMTYLVGDIIAMMIFSRVVLPAPFSPTIQILDSEFAPMLTPLKIVRSVDG
jgi:hypothetical protein